ncbi:MAG: cytochrome b N-terminal domain-containing protein [Planctomycetota bacterium]|jgi:cytochrome b6
MNEEGTPTAPQSADAPEAAPPSGPGTEKGGDNPAAELGQKIGSAYRSGAAFLETRLGLRSIILWLKAKRIPPHVNLVSRLGTIAVTLFLMQMISGIFLAVYYRGAPDQAYESIRFIMTDVSLGWLLRGIHRWAGECLLLVAGFHLIRIFITGAFKKPRELNWILGVLMSFLLVGFRFTGQLLPWDQHALWSTMSGIEVVEAIPIVGHLLLGLLWGGETIDGSTLGRFYTAHVLVLPWAAMILLALHFLVVRKQGFSGGEK